jgi:hypothetical protein
METVQTQEETIQTLLEKTYNFQDMENTDDETVLTLLHRAWKRWRNHKIIEEILIFDHVWNVTTQTDVRDHTKFKIWTKKPTKKLESLVSKNSRRFKIKVLEHYIPEI